MIGLFRLFFVLNLLTLLQAPLFSQTLPKKLQQANWQQQVDFRIQVQLDPRNRMMQGFEELTYLNNSPDTLRFIYMHLWPNAYKNRTTAFAKQEIQNGHTGFHFADPSGRGWIDSLDFRVGGTSLKWELTENIDVAIIHLKEPLLPGNKLHLSTPFWVKIPDVFSRMGYENGIFCITQWYPKPAVYDVNGWNPMPYLNQGEFYSEFGRFEVSITLPKNYVLAATGQVQETEEKAWWKQRSTMQDAPHPSPDSLKTLHFVQDSVHDFAWFCSKKFMCDFGEVVLNDGRKVETWIFAVPSGENKKPHGLEYINEAVKFYSEKVGNYPYSIAQVVITPLKAGGGMEYPTITNCATAERTVIVHEVGHNWFYGILGSNEREYPWMDESINTYYESRQKDESKPESGGGHKGNAMNLVLKLDQAKLLTYHVMRRNVDQAGDLPSEAYENTNYGAIIYSKNPLAFKYLQNYLGDSRFDALMQDYFRQWKFRHPLPGDFRKVAEDNTQENLDWFFHDLLGSTKKMDYQLTGGNQDRIRIKNAGDWAGPFPIAQVIGDSVMPLQWHKGFTGTTEIPIGKTAYTQWLDTLPLVFRIDPTQVTPDLYSQNNSRVLKGFSRAYNGMKLQPLVHLENAWRPQTFWLPVYAWNAYNQSMLGLAFYNSVFPQKKNEFALVPMYSFTTKDLNGYGQYEHHWYTGGKIRSIDVGFRSARFAADGFVYNSGDPIVSALLDTMQSLGTYPAYYTGMHYEKLAPYIQLRLQPSEFRTRIEQRILLRYVMVNEQARDRSLGYGFGRDHYGIAELKYTYNRPHALYPCEAMFSYQQGIQQVQFNKTGLEILQGFKFMEGKKTLQIRFFAGAFLFEKTRVSGSRSDLLAGRTYFQAGARTGANDYLYDEAMMGRNKELQNIANPLNPSNSASENVFGRQVLSGEAGFRNFVRLGGTNTFLTALNLSMPFPIPVPVGLYGDFVYWQIPHSYLNGGTELIPATMQLSYTGGVSLNLLKNILSIHVPLIQSSDVNDAWNTSGYAGMFSRTSFVLNLKTLNPLGFIRDLKF